MIGNLLGNRYEIISQLGGGGMALVYKARDTLLNRQVTVKVLRPEYTGDEEFVSRFRKEAQAVAKLSHPNIVSVYDVGQAGDIYYIVMEYVEGRNLKQIIKEQGRLTVSQATSVARQICDGLQHAHLNGIVHRDIKPHNILVTDSGRIKVTDFGIAQMMSSVTTTDSGAIVGSVHYFSPEQARGETTGAKSDIYSVGVVLYEMLTGKVPFTGESPIAIVLKHIQDKPLPPSALNPQVSPELERVVLRAMEKDLTMRYKTAGDMARDLSRLGADGSAEKAGAAAEDEFATRVMNGPVIYTRENNEENDLPAYKRKKRKMRPLVKILIIAAVLGLLAGGGYGLNVYLNVEEVKVPDVKNLSLTDAQKKLQANNLNMETVFRYDLKVAAGYVISQEPLAHRRVKRNATVTLAVSQGPEFAVVPNVVKKELEAARIELENAGFKVAPVEQFSSEVPAAAVIGQSPEGDTQAVKGSTVKLTVSKGTEPKPVLVPDLTGLSLEAARAELDKVKLKLSSDLTQEQSTTYPPGHIISQDPAPGSNILQEGAEVKVVLSKGPGPEAKTARIDVEIPDDGLTHRVKIVVQDVAGTRVALGPEEHNPGEKFTRLVTYYNAGKIQVFIDDMVKPARERLVD